MVDQGGFCTECGTAVSSTDKFCAGCGHILGGGVPASSTSSKPRASPQQKASGMDFGIPKWGWRIILPFIAISAIALWWALPSTESETSRDPALSGEVWTPPMMAYMRSVFMTDCQGLVLSDPGLGSVAELFSATPLGVCVCATEFVMSNWTPVEFVKAGERPSTFGYELGGGITACLTERADYLTERAD